MRFAISTHSVLADVKTNEHWEIDHINVLATGHHYGIALPTRNGTEFMTMVRETNLITTYKKSDSRCECSYDEIGSFVCNGEYSDIHQIAYHDNGIFIANTGFNSIDYFSFDTLSSERLFLNGYREDVNHVNSVYPYGLNLLLIVLNNRGAMASELTLIKRHSGTGFEVIKHFPLPDKECHNVFVDGKVLVYNASKNGSVVFFDLYTGKEIQRISFPGYTKGLSVTRDYFIAGYSEIASRVNRRNSQGYLAIIRRKTLDVEACINLSISPSDHHIGNVNEVRCLSERDYGHSCLEIESIDLNRIEPNVKGFHIHSEGNYATR